MPIQAQSADGMIHEFPDGTDPSIVDKAMKSYSQKKPEPSSLDLGDVAVGAVTSIPHSAVQFAKNVAQPIIDPLGTAKGLGNLALGVGEKLGISPTTGHEQFADAAGQAFLERYGGWENLKKTIATDPVGFVGDLSLLFTGGGGLLRAVPAAAKAAETAGTIGRTINPVNLAIQGARKGVEAGTEAIGNIGTGSGAAAIASATQAGLAGGPARQAFVENMRQPEANAAAIVPKARAALEQVRLERSADYQKAMAAFGQRANQPLSFKSIYDAIDRERKARQFQGQDVSTLAGENKPTAARLMLDDIERNVKAWESHSDPAIRTAAGLDKLKQHIGDKIDWMGKPKSANTAAQAVYAAIKDTIVQQDPKYAEIMRDYSEASDLLHELEKSLSLGKKVTEDTALRKLLSTTRSNVNTNFGRRAALAEVLNRYDPTLIPSLAGQSLAGFVPHGLVGKAAAAAAGGAAPFHPGAALGLPFTSPRLVGETAVGLGSAARKARDLTPDMIKKLIGQIDPDVAKQVLLLYQGGARAGQ